MAAVFTLAIVGCQREGCTDPKATNYDSDAKKDNGTCVYSKPEQDSVIPTKEKTFDWDWTMDTTFTPPFDSLKKYVDDPTYKYIFINMVNKNNQYEGVEGSPCDFYRARDFRRARDSVYSIADKCNGKLLMSGIINVHPTNGAQLHDTVAPNTRGMWKRDSIDLSALRVHIKRLSH